MGFLSKIFKTFKKIFKAVGSAVKKVFKEVKRFAKSKLGKFLIAAAAIYFGGQALGVFGKASSVASTVPVVESSVAALGPGATAADIASFATQTGAASTAGTAAGIGEAGAALTGAEVGGGIAGLTQTAVTETVKEQATKTLFSRAIDAAKATGKWMQENPIPTMAAGKFISSAFTPSAEEIEQNRIRSSNIGGLNYGDPYEGAPPLRTAITSSNLQSDLQNRTY